MAAKDYRICCAMFNAYIAKTSKRNPNLMLKDRREITEGEILHSSTGGCEENSPIQIMTHK